MYISKIYYIVASSALCYLLSYRHAHL